MALTVTLGQQPERIALEVAYVRRRRRLSVAFRLILAIPQLIVTGALGVASFVVGVIGWFGALFTGRLPYWAADFMAGFLGWETRVVAYYLLLVDYYPPFDFAAPPSYPIQLSVPPPGRLNRWAVAFRIILAIPAYVVSVLVGTGLAIASVVIWLILVVGGRMPRPLFQAMASVVRYATRYYGYLLLLTPAYPSGLYAEAVPWRDWGAASSTPPVQPAPACAVPPVPPNLSRRGWIIPPGAAEPGAGPSDPLRPGAAPLGAGSPGEPGASIPPTPTPTPGAGPGRAWPVVAVPITAGAKGIIALFMVLGLAYQFVYWGTGGFAGFNLAGLGARLELGVAHSQFVSADRQAANMLHACQAHGPTLSCREVAFAAEGTAYASYAASLSSITYPPAANADAKALLGAVRRAGEAYLRVSGARSTSAFAADVRRARLSRLTTVVQYDYSSLDHKLS